MAKTIRSWRPFIAKARKAVSLLQLKAFDTATPAGRSKERDRRAALTAIASVAAKALTVLTALISVPLTYRYLGSERYGLWMTISSVITMFAFADLGIGNGLLNRISEAHGRNDRSLAKKYVSSAFFMLLGVALCLALVFSLVHPLISWSRVFNVSSQEAITEGKQAVLVFAACFLINLPLGVIARVQLGYQRGFVNSIWSVAGNTIGLVGVLIAIKLEAGLPWLVLAMAGTPVLASVFNGVVLFGFQERGLIPQWANAHAESIRSLFRLGASFFVLQLCYAFAFTSDNLIAAQILDQEAVAHLSIVARLFGIIPMLMDMILSPLWPAYGESLARGDFGWVKRTLQRTAIFGGISAACAAMLLIVGGNQILRLWVGSGVEASFLLLLGFGIWTVFSALGSSVAMFLNGSGRLKFQMMCGVGLAVVAPTTKILLALKFGLTGIIWGTVLTYLVCIALPMALYVPLLLNHLQEGAKQCPTPTN